MTDELAKAGQEIAKTTRIIVERTGPFIGRVFGPPIENGVGILTDRLKYFKLKQYLSLVDKTQRLLEEHGVAYPRFVPAPVVLPLIEAATIEEDDHLHDRWAAMLSTAMDPSKPPIKRSYVSILRELEPTDVALLDLLYDMTFADKEVDGFSTTSGGGFSGHAAVLARAVSVPEDECELGLFNLSRLECTMFGITPGLTRDDYLPIEYITLRLTALGKALVESCRS